MGVILRYSCVHTTFWQVEDEFTESDDTLNLKTEKFLYYENHFRMIADSIEKIAEENKLKVRGAFTRENERGLNTELNGDREA
jgi:hypothetical protein